MASVAKSAGDSGRRAERRPVNGSARLRPNSWSSLEVAMLDLSENGFRARSEARMKVGGTVSVDIPCIGSVDAQVEWHRRNEFGARFYQPIDLEACGWTLQERGHALAQLLVSRAGAKAAGRADAEADLRRRILASLPMRKMRLSAD
jgi:hypothetical protein